MASTFEDEDALARHLPAWDALATRLSRPFCAPAWLLAWFHHVAAPGDALRLVTVLSDDELVGVGPFFCPAGRGPIVRWRPLGAGTCQRVEPLALPGVEHEVAAALGQAFARARVDVLTLEGVGAASPWPRLLASTWPGKRHAWTHRRGVRTALTVELRESDVDGWLAGRSSHFRQRLRKNRKELAKRGGTARLATAETLQRDLESFIRLHTARWEARGGSLALTAGVDDMLREAGRHLPAGRRLRVWTLEVEGKAIASSVVLAAGHELGYWLNGFDERFANISPSRLSIFQVIEDAFAIGARRVDLGEGDFEYKRRFADGEETLEWLWIVPRGRRYPLARLALAASQSRGAAAARLPPETRHRLLELSRRAP